MATILAKIASSSSSPTNQTISSSIYRLFSINFQRSFSTSPAPATASSDFTSAASKKPKRKKKKNLFEVAQFLPNWGIGFHMAKSHWTNVTYELTKINLYKDGRHGKAWGIAYKDEKALVILQSLCSKAVKSSSRELPVWIAKDTKSGLESAVTRITSC